MLTPFLYYWKFSYDLIYYAHIKAHLPAFRR